MHPGKTSSSFQRRMLAFLLLPALSILHGCGSTLTPPVTTPPADGLPSAPVTNVDPCATRLHELCGPLLQYAMLNNHLPATLAELRPLDGSNEPLQFICPVSGRPYIYDPAGLPGNDPRSRLILYDPLPSHNGLRWAVELTIPETGPATTKVRAIKDGRIPRAVP